MTTNLKSLQTIYAGRKNQVGDGFQVNSALPHQNLRGFSPFLMLDHAGPFEVKASNKPKGVGAHPHRGFETVTLLYQGGVTHRDSQGNQGTLRPGDVQWMTAASGIVHEEMHSEEFTRSGGTLELVQLWVNLPQKFKMTKPRYQDIQSSAFPTKKLGQNSSLRLVAGQLEGLTGPANTFSPVVVSDLELAAGDDVFIQIPDGYTTAFYVRSGDVSVNGGEGTVKKGHMGLFAREGNGAQFSAVGGSASIVLLAGEPINEQIASYGPFVMNTQEEIYQAMDDYNTGKMGAI